MSDPTIEDLNAITSMEYSDVLHIRRPSAISDEDKKISFSDFYADQMLKIIDLSVNTTLVASQMSKGRTIINFDTGTSNRALTLPAYNTLEEGALIEITKINSEVPYRLLINSTSGNINNKTSINLSNQWNSVLLRVTSTGFTIVSSNIVHIEDWQNITDWTNAEININHRLNVYLNDLTVNIYLSPTGSDTDCILYRPTTNIYDASSPANLNLNCAIQPFNVDLSNFKLQTGDFGVVFIDDSGARVLLGGSSSYYIKVVARLNAL